MSEDTPSDDSSAHDAGSGPDSGEAAGEQAEFNLQQIHRLGSIMQKFDLSEVRLRRTTDAAEENWTLRRGATVAVAPVAAAAPAPVAAPAAAPAAAASAPSGEAAPSGGGSTGAVIKSPTVGTFYSRPSPDDPAFVKPGDSVSPDTVVCLIEAMKVFNQIPAETSGKIKRILLTDGDAVEHGQPMFELE